MPTRDTGEQQHALAPADDEQVEETVGARADLAARKEALDADIDAILDDIDEVLETNAEEFVRGVRPEGRPVSSERRPAGPCRRVPRAGLVVVRRVPRQHDPVAAARRPPAAARARPSSRTARHHDRRADLRRRRRHGRRPARHDGQRHRPADIEKVFPADESQLRGHRRHGGPRGRDGQALPGRARALREDRGRAALASTARPTGSPPCIRGNLGMAMQGLAVVPLFAGYDPETGGGRIFSYDVTGGRYEEHRHHGVGSGSMFARGALKKLWRDDLSTTEARHASPSRPVRRRRRRLRHRRPRPRPRHLPGDRRRRRRRLPPARRGRARPASCGRSSRGSAPDGPRRRRCPPTSARSTSEREPPR